MIEAATRNYNLDSQKQLIVHNSNYDVDVCTDTTDNAVAEESMRIEESPLPFDANIAEINEMMDLLTDN
ncbi:hypothetical protein evm_004206 [Chilo suppressalis]|nr:hypothetical protein evm_004206 [Chilo suppressalis]